CLIPVPDLGKELAILKCVTHLSAIFPVATVPDLQILAAWAVLLVVGVDHSVVVAPLLGVLVPIFKTGADPTALIIVLKKFAGLIHPGSGPYRPHTNYCSFYP